VRTRIDQIGQALKDLNSAVDKGPKEGRADANALLKPIQDLAASLLDRIKTSEAQMGKSNEYAGQTASNTSSISANTSQIAATIGDIAVAGGSPATTAAAGSPLQDALDKAFAAGVKLPEWAKPVAGGWEVMFRGAEQAIRLTTEEYEANQQKLKAVGIDLLRTMEFNESGLIHFIGVGLQTATGYAQIFYDSIDDFGQIIRRTSKPVEELGKASGDAAISTGTFSEVMKELGRTVATLTDGVKSAVGSIGESVGLLNIPQTIKESPLYRPAGETTLDPFEMIRNDTWVGLIEERDRLKRAMTQPLYDSPQGYKGEGPSGGYMGPTIGRDLNFVFNEVSDPYKISSVIGQEMELLNITR
jgi:hypothetical protein